MAFVITEPCIGVKDASCTDVCPVDYYIDPGECIDCAYCEAVCPVNAIFDEFTVPPNWRQYIQRNREYFKKR
jgi:ferredoxin